MDEIDCGGFFDHIDDLLVDFSGDDVDAGLGPKPETTSFPSIWSTTQSDSLPASDSVFSGNSASDLSAELSLPVNSPLPPPIFELQTKKEKKNEIILCMCLCDVISSNYGVVFFVTNHASLAIPRKGEKRWHGNFVSFRVGCQFFVV